MKGVFFNSLVIALSVIGTVIGAGFITGREIVRFIYGANKYIAAIILFVAFFVLSFFYLSVKDKIALFIAEKCNYAVYFFSVMIMAAMLGATDSLFYSVFDFPKNIPVFSIALFIFSTCVCFKGLDGINATNSIIVPLMVVCMFAVMIMLIVNNSGVSEQSIITGRRGNAFVIFGYVGMNMLLSQPFFLKLKKEKKKFSPFLVAVISAVVLSLSVFLFLCVLNDQSAVYDIPVLYLLSGFPFAKYVFACVILAGIVTTLICSHYPLYSLLEKTKYPVFCEILLAVSAFIISRLGFYGIVDNLYPIVAYFSVGYFIVIISISILRARAGRPTRTLRRQERIK